MPTILLVEDNEMNRDMLTRRLERRGFCVITAQTGEQAVVVARWETPDLILMDIQLPGMNGLETTRVLKRDDATCQIPVMALTARALVSDREQVFEAGCDDYDTKPVDFQRLTDKIEKLLGEKKTL
jgi:two-component system cell cycle response regulator DivK